MKKADRLHEIEKELDKTAPWEDPPYRNARRRLNREREKLLRSDPMKFVGREGSYQSLNIEQRKLHRLKRQVLRIVNALEVPKWWERFK